MSDRQTDWLTDWTYFKPSDIRDTVDLKHPLTSRPPSFYSHFPLQLQLLLLPLIEVCNLTLLILQQPAFLYVELFLSLQTWRQTWTTWRQTGTTWRQTGTTWRQTGTTWRQTGTTWRQTGTTWRQTGTTWRQTRTTWRQPWYGGPHGQANKGNMSHHNSWTWYNALQYKTYVNNKTP